MFQLVGVDEHGGLPSNVSSLHSIPEQMENEVGREGWVHVISEMSFLTHSIIPSCKTCQNQSLRYYKVIALEEA